MSLNEKFQLARELSTDLTTYQIKQADPELHSYLGFLKDRTLESRIKKMALGDMGLGVMASLDMEEVETKVDAIIEYLNNL